MAEGNQLKGLLIDLGGVVFQGSNTVAGSMEAIAILRKNHTPFRFLTNTTSQSKTTLIKNLDQMGIPVSAEEVFTPVDAAKIYIENNGLNPNFLIDERLRDDFFDIRIGDHPALIIGDARNDFSYDNMNAAFRTIAGGAQIIALASNRSFSDESGDLCLDVGAYVAALEYASGKKATVLGKPAPEFFHLAAHSLSIEPANLAMIGDDAEFDASAAINAGLSGIVVRTGKWREGDMEDLSPRPEIIYDNLLQAVEVLSSEHRSTLVHI